MCSWDIVLGSSRPSNGNGKNNNHTRLDKSWLSETSLSKTLGQANHIILSGRTTFIFLRSCCVGLIVRIVVLLLLQMACFRLYINQCWCVRSVEKICAWNKMRDQMWSSCEQFLFTLLLLLLKVFDSRPIILRIPPNRHITFGYHKAMQLHINHLNILEEQEPLCIVCWRCNLSPY